MKKIVSVIMAMAMVVSVGTAGVFAAGHGRGFTDTNQDGICDHLYTNCAYVDENGDGICDTVSYTHLFRNLN